MEVAVSLSLLASKLQEQQHSMQVRNLDFNRRFGCSRFLPACFFLKAVFQQA
jgi:uncharacterized membrane protein